MSESMSGLGGYRPCWRVAVDPDDLERLVRDYHEWAPIVPEAADVAEAHECRCGWSGDQSEHGSHVAHVVREAMAGRL